VIHEVDVDAILTGLQALAEDTTGAATVAILACMDVVERHGRIAAETEIAVRLQVQPVPSLIVQHRTGQPEPALLDQLAEQADPEVAELTGWPCPWCKTEDEHRAEVRKYMREAGGEQ